VPYAAGGGADLLARVLAQELSSRTKRQFIVENRTGGGTVVGTRAVIGATPDGYTLLMTQTSLPISTAVVPHLEYDVKRDLTPIVNVALGPNGLFVHPSVPATNLKEFLTYAKSNPGKLSYSSGGAATVSHLAGESLNALAGIDLVHVPARGMGPALIDLIAGQVQATFGSMAASLQESRNGGIRLLAVAERKRTRWSPEVPTIEEMGFPGFEAGNWTALLGPGNLDREIVEYLNKLVVQILALPEVRERLFGLGFEIIASTPIELAERIEHDVVRWTEVAKRAGVIQPMNSTKDAPANVVSTKTTKPQPSQKMSGTYRLVSSTRTLVDTGRVIDSFGKDPAGYIMYADDGRMMVLIVRADRPKPTHEDMTDQQRAELFRSMAAYAGRYSFDGKRVVHHIDISWNEILTGKDVVREVEVENGGQRLIYRSGPGPSPTDGTVTIGKLVWEKVD
jgi:tripartite-type tricarboxylate transporter receptor subunit TctC